MKIGRFVQAEMHSDDYEDLIEIKCWVDKKKIMLHFKSLEKSFILTQSSC